MHSSFFGIAAPWLAIFWLLWRDLKTNDKIDALIAILDDAFSALGYRPGGIMDHEAAARKAEELRKHAAAHEALDRMQS